MVRRTLLVMLAVLVAVGAWWYVAGGKDHGASLPETSSTAHPRTSELIEPDEKLTAGVVGKLTMKLTSTDRSTYEAIWVHGNVPPMAPKGTTIEVIPRTLRSYKTAGQVEVMVAVRGKDPVTAVVTLEFTDHRWLVQGMEAK